MAASPRKVPGRGATIVTGAAGFAGSHLLARLAGQTDVVAWSRTTPETPRPKTDVTWQTVDLMDGEAVARAVETIRPARIFHLAGAPSVASSWTSAVPHLQINALGTHYVLDAVRRAGRPCRVLVVTSAQVYAHSGQPLREDDRLLPQSPYGLTKLAQDQLATAAAAEIEVVIARPFNHIGPGQGPGFAVPAFARQIAAIERGVAAPVLRVGNLDTARDITDVRDVVDAYVRIMESGVAGRPYNVCSGVARRTRDLLDALLAQSPGAIAVEIDAERLRPNDVPLIVGDAGRIRTELGWQPNIPLEQTLRDTLEDARRRVEP